MHGSRSAKIKKKKGPREFLAPNVFFKVKSKDRLYLLTRLNSRENAKGPGEDTTCILKLLLLRQMTRDKTEQICLRMTKHSLYIQKLQLNTM